MISDVHPDGELLSGHFKFFTQLDNMVLQIPNIIHRRRAKKRFKKVSTIGAMLLRSR